MLKFTQFASPTYSSFLLRFCAFLPVFSSHVVLAYMTLWAWAWCLGIMGFLMSVQVKDLSPDSVHRLQRVYTSQRIIIDAGHCSDLDRPLDQRPTGNECLPHVYWWLEDHWTCIIFHQKSTAMGAALIVCRRQCRLPSFDISAKLRLCRDLEHDAMWQLWTRIRLFG